MLVALDLIDVDPRNPRGEIDDVTDLKITIGHDGLQDPLQVIRQANGRWKLHEGHRRYKALVELGVTHTEVIVKTFATDLDQMVAQGVLHAHRRDFNPMAWARYVYRLFSEHNLSRDAIAYRLGVSPNWVRDHLSFVRLLPAEQRELEAGQMTRREALLRLAERRAALAGQPAPTHKTRTTTGGPAAPTIPTQRRAGETYFNRQHVLAEQVTALCTRLQHGPSSKIGGVGCGVCWETVIRADAITARPALIAA